MEDPARRRRRVVLGELLDHMEEADEVASGLAQERPEYEAMAAVVHQAKELVVLACESEAYAERDEND